MSAPPIAEKLERATTALIARSIRAYVNPHTMFDWPSQPPQGALAMSEALLPLAGHPLFATLRDEQRWRLALLEAVNFFSLNIAGERELMIGLAQRLYSRRPASVSRYLQSFLHEENAHTVVFARFCLDYGGVIYPDRQMRFPRQFRRGEEEFLFFARVLVFEEIAHVYNRRVAADDAVWPIARDIHRYHAEDESRHIAFGRLVVAEMWERLSSEWSEAERREIGGYVERYIDTVLGTYVNPAVLTSLGFVAEAPTVRAEILASSHWTALAAESSRVVRAWLRRIGVFDAG
jgi:hypothetical protein